MDVVEEKRDELKRCLAAAFPEVFSDGTIDFDQLKRVLGERAEPGKERFGLTWSGKAECMKIIQQPSVATLKPVRDESVTFDETQNLFIEGDNLEVLKLLQKAYFGKVKMIYIDPPYNTGKEFIYPDKYAETLDTYLEYTGQIDTERRKFSTNTDTTGRYHSRWLSMMYPRLYLARNLLREDGVACISIDDNEQSSLKLISNAIFGDENFLGTIVWKNATDNNPTNIAVEHEYVHVYAKNKDGLERTWKSHVSDVKNKLIEIGGRLVKAHKDPDGLQGEYSRWFRENKAFLWPLDRYKFIDSDGVYTGSQSVHNPGKEGYRYDVMHPTTVKPCKEPLMGYRFPEETMRRLLETGKVLFGEDETKIVELKVYARDFQDKLSSVLELDGRLGAYDLRELFPDIKKAFTNPKPVRFLTHFMPFVLKDDDIALDFFAGSCTTAHAVFHLNAEDTGARQFIMVQLPEPCDPDSELSQAGFRNIADIGKERLRRAAKKFATETATQRDLDDESPQDLGFKVFKLDRSNFKVWDGDVEKTEDLSKQLSLHIHHIAEESSTEDILYELLLKAGFPLTTKVQQREMAGKEVFSFRTVIFSSAWTRKSHQS